MPQPDIGAEVVRGNLQTASIAYKNQGYIANEVYPILTLPTNKSKVTLYNRGDAYRDEAVLRARGTETDSLEYKLSTTNINTKQYAAKHIVTKEDLRDAGVGGIAVPPVNLQMDAVEFNADKLDLNQEIQVASNVTEGTWADGNAGGEDADAKWVASSGNTFLTDVDNGINTLEGNGIPRNNIRLMMDAVTVQGVIRVSEVTTPMAYTATTAKAPGLVITSEMLASLLTIDKVVVGRAIYSTAKEKADGTDFTVARIWGATKGFAFLYYFPPRVGLKTMTAGYSAFTNMENGQRRATYRWYNNDRHSWMYESQQEFGAQQINANAGYLWKDTHTT